jgi:hypothetical protein
LRRKRQLGYSNYDWHHRWGQVQGKERSKVENAIKSIENVQKRVIQKEDDIEKNIYDIIKAIDSLLDVTSIDISNIRLMMDGILKVWEGRYYLGLI